jgi:hypothetical protein
MDTSGTLLTVSLLEDFVTLFRGRGDVYGAWAGGCVKEPLTSDKFMGHLQGDEPIGVYPLLPYKGSWYCVWGCSDIDVEDLDAARNLQMALVIKGVKSWVERTRKGYHVWVFADSMVPASTMRRALLAAHQAINYPAKEVNPKQETVSGTGYGNYVRLPYPGAILEHPRERYILDDEENQMRLAEFVFQAMENRTDLETLEAIANMWVPPQPRHIMTLDSSADVRQILRKVGPIPYVMWRDGPMEGNDRSSTLFRLSCKMRDAGLDPAEALVVLRSADQRWGKFHLRPDGEAELAKIVERSFEVTVQ